MSRKFLQDNFVSVFSSILIGMGNWFFGYMILRLVSENDLTRYQAFVGLLGIFSIPGMWIILMTTKLGHTFNLFVKDFFSKNKALFYFAGLVLLVGTFVACIVSNIETYFFGLLFFLTSLALISSYYRGMLQHELMFVKLAYIGLFEVVMKIGIFLAFVFLDLKPASMFAAVSIQSSVSVYILYKISKDLRSHLPAVSIRKEAILTFFYGFGMVFFSSIDVIMAKRLLDSQSNVNYIAILQIIKLLFFASSALINVLLPSASKTNNAKELFKMVTITAFLIIMGSITLMGITYFEFGKISELFRIKDVNVNLAVLFLGYACLFSLSQIPMTILLIKKVGSLKYVISAIVLVQAALYIVVGHNLLSFIHIYGVVAGLLFVGSSSALAYYYKKQPIQYDNIK
jgi:O-antigen/teichoic acid export membrane protein